MSKVKFSDPIFFLNIIGMDPYKWDRFSMIRHFTSSLLYFVVIFSGILEIVFHSHGLETYARASDTMIPQYELIWKMITLTVYRRQIMHLIEDTKQFWPLDKFKTKHTAPSRRVHSFLKKFFLVYKILITFTCLQFIVVNVVFKMNKPVCITYGESEGLEPLVTHIYFVLHFAVTFVSINIVNGFDGLYFFLIGHILSELHMVKIAFGRYDIGTEWTDSERFRSAAEHHSFVLNFVQEFNRVYRKLLLNQHGACLFSICFGLLLMNKDGIPPDVQKASKYMPYIISFLLQTWTFCFTGHLITTWSTDISDEIFYVDWSKDEAYKNKQGKIIAIVRGQKGAVLTLGKFGNLDLESFRFVIKNSFSFLTFMNTVIQQQQHKEVGY